jgi:hypothetical protein
VTLPFWIHHHVNARRVAEVFDVGERINMVASRSILATFKLSMSLSRTRSQGRRKLKNPSSKGEGDFC